MLEKGATAGLQSGHGPDASLSSSCQMPAGEKGEKHITPAAALELLGLEIASQVYIGQCQLTLHFVLKLLDSCFTRTPLPSKEFKRRTCEKLCGHNQEQKVLEEAEI